MKKHIFLLLGVTGRIPSAVSALLHNTSTLAISMSGMSGWKNIPYPDKEIELDNITVVSIN